LIKRLIYLQHSPILATVVCAAVTTWAGAKSDWYFNTAKEWNTPEAFTVNFLSQSAR